MLPRIRPALGALTRPFQFRAISSTAARLQSNRDDDVKNLGDMILTRQTSPLSSLSGIMDRSVGEAVGEQFNTGGYDADKILEREPYHLNVLSTRHNTHVTFTNPQKNIIISLSAGNIGFKKAARGKYDAAYQLAAKVFKTLAEDIKIRPHAIEVVLRGNGQGREAVMKALMGTEGRHFKSQVTRVTDSTRLKFGGVRSKKPRRLG